MTQFLLFILVIGVGLFYALKYGNEAKRNIASFENNKEKNVRAQNGMEPLDKMKQQTHRKLRLVMSSGFDQDLNTIAETATPEIIKRTMKSIDWNIFHIIQLEDENDNALHVSGSLVEDGIASGFVTDDDHLLMVEPIESVDQMIEILLDFLEGEDVWRNKYKYQ